jgi:hypothetical protein
MCESKARLKIPSWKYPGVWSEKVKSDAFMACIDPQDIPQSILPPAASAKKKAEAIGPLKAYSIRVHVHDGQFSLHRLVHLIS